MSAFHRISPLYKATMQAIETFGSKEFLLEDIMQRIEFNGFDLHKAKEVFAVLKKKGVVFKNKESRRYKITTIGMKTLTVLDELPVIQLKHQAGDSVGKTTKKNTNLTGKNNRPTLPSEAERVEIMSKNLPESMKTFTESASAMMGEYGALREATERYVTECAEILGYKLTKKQEQN